MDFNKIEKTFKEYINKYDMRFKMNKVKDAHSFRVSVFAGELATRLGMKDSEIELAKVIGILHDIGRFEQLKLHNSFKDSKYDHADEGVNYLFGRKHIRSFIEDDKYDKIIYDAIKNHNKYKIEDGLEDESLRFAKLIRDVDKVDILNVTAKINKYEFNIKDLSPKIKNSFYSKSSSLFDDQKTKTDRTVFMMSFIFDINYKETFEILKENKFFENWVKLVNVKKDSLEEFKEMMKFLNIYIEERL